MTDLDVLRDPQATAPAPSESAHEEVLFAGHPAPVRSALELLVCVLTLGLGFLYLFVRSRSVSYRITTERVVVETGLLGKRLDQIDLYRIHDYVVERPLGQRMLGTGDLVLMTVDRTSPAVRLSALRTDVVALYERLRKATEEQKRRRGVRVLDADRVG